MTVRNVRNVRFGRLRTRVYPVRNVRTIPYSYGIVRSDAPRTGGTAGPEVGQGSGSHERVSISGRGSAP